MRVVAKNIVSKLIAVIAIATFSISILPINAHAFSCPVLQKSKGGADLLIIGSLVLRRDAQAPEKQLGAQRRGVLEEESVGYVSRPSIDGAAQLIIRDEDNLEAISILTRDSWVTTTQKHWIVVENGIVSCGPINESSPTISSSILSQPNLLISTETVQVLSSKTVLAALGL